MKPLAVIPVETKLSEYLFVFIVIASHLLFSLPALVIAEDNWLLDQKADFEQLLANLKSKEVFAQGVLDQARHAETKAIEVQDHEALPIARQAVNLAQQGVAEAQKRVTRQQAKVSALGKAVHLGPGITGFTVEAQGTVLKLQGGKWVPLQSAGPLQPGEAIRTGRNGTAEVIFNDGSKILMGPNSEFIYSNQTEKESIYRFIKGLLHSRMRVRNPSACIGCIRGQLIRYNMPVAVAGVRGTELDLRVDDKGLTHLVPYSGTVEMTALPEAMAKVKLDRWWEKGKAIASKPLPEGKLVRVAFTQGEVKIEGADGAAHAAAVGDLLAGGEKIATGGNGFAQVELVDGTQGTLAANTRLEITTKETPEAMRYEIQQGHMHAICSKETGTRLVGISTPNAVIKGPGAEFDVTVDPQGLADVIPLSATVEVTAQRDKLNAEKMKLWWEEP